MMRSVITLFFLTVTALWSQSAGQQAEALAAKHGSEKQLLDVDKAWAATAMAGDVDALVAYWEKDATLYPVGMSPIHGTDNIRQFITTNRAKGMRVSREPQRALVGASDDMGATQGLFNVTIPNEDGTTSERKGYYVCVWKKMGGKWKCVMSISSFEDPGNK